MDIGYSRSDFPVGLLNRQIIDTGSIKALDHLHEQPHSNTEKWFDGVDHAMIGRAFRC